MADVVIQSVVPTDAELIHRFRNFGEDVYREFNGKWTVSLAEIDSAVDHFHVRDIKPRHLRRTKKRLAELIEIHRFAEQIHVVDVST